MEIPFLTGLSEEKGWKVRHVNRRQAGACARWKEAVEAIVYRRSRDPASVQNHRVGDLIVCEFICVAIVDGAIDGHLWRAEAPL